MKRPAVHFIVFLLLMSLAVQTVFGGLPGTLDTTFGGTGIVFTTFTPSSVSIGNDIVVQPDGKIIVAGSSQNSGWLMARYNPDGSLDTTFGTGGRVITPIFNATDQSFSVALQPDGKIVAAGHSTIDFFSSYVALARFNPDGSLDSTFGSGGKSLSVFNGNYTVPDVIVLANGKIFIAAVPGSHIGVPAGILYNSSGFIERSFYFSATYLHAVASQADGKLLIAGSLSGSGDWTIWRFNPDGSPDTSFDGDGKVTPPISGIYGAQGILVKPDGKILAVGTSTNDVALVQLNPDGSLDTTFDGDGKVLVDVTGGADRGMDLALQANGKIIALGSSGSTFEIIRLLPNGALDTVFAGDGSAIITVGDLYVSGVAIQPDGKIVATGASSASGFGTVRFNGGGSPIFDFDGDAKTDISIYRPSLGQWWINKSSGGSFAAQFGASSDKITPGDFTGDGKTDIAFWRPASGNWYVMRSEDNSFYLFPFGLNGDIPTVGDFDGDNRSDAAIFRPSNGRWYVSRSSGGTTLQIFGQTGDVPVPADYDGDGKADIAIYRVASGQWWIQRSSTGTTSAFQFGNNSDKPVPGDYTGDGKADVAFWRPSTGEWFVLRSENQTYYAYPFGLSTDTPSPGDYDGDGKFDPAIFRPSNSRWYVQRTTAGTLIQGFGQTGDTPVPSAFVP